MRIQRIPTKLERWFLELCAAEMDHCAQNGNRLGMSFWYEIGYRAREEFYYTR